jgi:hypothetical protein
MMMKKDCLVKYSMEQKKIMFQSMLSDAIYARLEIFTAMQIHVTVFWVMMLCSNVVGYLSNVGILPHHYTLL